MAAWGSLGGFRGASSDAVAVACNGVAPSMSRFGAASSMGLWCAELGDDAAAAGCWIGGGMATNGSAIGAGGPAASVAG